MVNNDSNKMMSMLYYALFEEKATSFHAENGNELLEELNKHCVLPFAKPLLKNINLTDEQRSNWEKQILNYISTNMNVVHTEKKIIELLNRNCIKNVILKGSSFAQYYPNPVVRVRGDIDLLVDENDFNKTAELLMAEGYTTESEDLSKGRHVEFFKNGIEIELHRYFSKSDRESKFFNVSKAMTLSNGLNSFPPLENGISMLLHIKFHFGQLGIRHYLDWIMYVSKICDDTFWNCEFKKYADEFDVTNLAKMLTKLGKRYFPLSHVTWCDDIDDSLCDDLLTELCNSGNFNENVARQKSLTITSSNKSPMVWIKMIGQKGIENWDPAQKHKILVPIAFFKQLNVYAKLYLRERNGLHLVNLIKETKRRKRLNKSILK